MSEMLGIYLLRRTTMDLYVDETHAAVVVASSPTKAREVLVASRSYGDEGAEVWQRADLSSIELVSPHYSGTYPKPHVMLKDAPPG